MVYQSSVGAILGRQRANSWSSVVPNKAVINSSTGARKSFGSINTMPQGRVENDELQQNQRQLHEDNVKKINSVGKEKQRSFSIQSGIDIKNRSGAIEHRASINERKTFLAHLRIKAREEEFQKLHYPDKVGNEPNDNDGSPQNNRHRTSSMESVQSIPENSDREGEEEEEEEEEEGGN